MYLDVRELRNFYYRSALGRAAQRAMRDRLVALWPEAKGQTVVGFGFAVPLLRPYLGQARRIVGLMPAPQGVMHWPPGRPNVSVLCDEARWPIEPGRVDKLVLLHGLDASDHQAAVLEECYRVLAPEGRLVVIVPNRVSLWARYDGTPFAASRPFTASQLEKRVSYHGFEASRYASALYQPPRDTRFWRKTSTFWERQGQKFQTLRAGGVHMQEFTKQVPRPARPGLGQILSKPLGVLEGITSEPGREPARGRITPPRSDAIGRIWPDSRKWGR